MKTNKPINQANSKPEPRIPTFRGLVPPRFSDTFKQVTAALGFDPQAAAQLLFEQGLQHLK